MKTKVLYNDSCNICRTEINHYKKLSESNQFEWIDVSDGNEACDLTKQSRNSLYRRLHVIENNEIISGAKAFCKAIKFIDDFGAQDLKQRHRSIS